MKKFKIAVLLLTMIAVSASPSFAVLRKDLQSVKGKVVSVNYSRTEVTVKDNSTGKDVTFSAPKGVDSRIMSGNDVLVLYTVGTTTAKSVRLVQPRRGRAGAMGATTAAEPAAKPAASKNSWY